MTLTLTQNAEESLLAVAAQRHLPPEEALEIVLSEAKAQFNEAVIGIQAGMADFDAGRWLSLEDVDARFEARRQARHA